jgi:DNA helicase-2/ATP-dependent DNA helicase PcrA
LEEIALINDIDSLEAESDKVILMTIHSAKGLEFDNVYLVGMEEGIFPGNQSIYGGEAEIEEERRLAYVAITRAKKNLTVTNTQSRMLFGSTNRNMPSRFLREIPQELCEISGFTPKTYEVKSFANNFTPSATSKKSSFISEKKQAVNSASYNIGQRVSHKTFGEGMILGVTPMGNDSLLEIAFDTVGTKKIMAGFAKLTIL